MQGKTLVPLLENPDMEWSEEILLENYYNKFGLGWAPLRCLRTDQYKLIEAPRPELYDLKEDPDELINLATAKPERVKELRTRVGELALDLSTTEPGRSTATQIHDDARAKLEALGYLSGGADASQWSAPFPSPEELATLIDPKDKTLVLKYLNFISEMLRSQRADEAVPVIYNALDLNPENYQLHLHLARALASLGRWERALEAAQRAQALRPENAAGYALAGTIHVANKEYQQALAPLTRAFELQPQNVRTLHQLAAAFLALGQDEQAIHHFEAVLELDDTIWRAAADLATAYFRTGRWPEAREKLQHALRLNPYSASLRHRIALFYRDTGNSEFSQKMFEEALRIEPNHLGANLELGALLLETGDRLSGCIYLKRVVALAPESSWGKRASKLLEDSSPD